MYSTVTGYQSSRDPPILMRRKFSITLYLCCWLTKTMVKFGSNPQEINHNGCSRLKGNADAKLSTWLYIRWREALQSYGMVMLKSLLYLFILGNNMSIFFLFFLFFPSGFRLLPFQKQFMVYDDATRNPLKIELICFVCLVSGGWDFFYSVVLMIRNKYCLKI